MNIFHEIKKIKEKSPNSRDSYLLWEAFALRAGSCSPGAQQQLACRAGTLRAGEPVCRKRWRFVTWDFLPGVLDLELHGPGYCVHNQKPFVTEPSPSQGAPAIVHTPGLPLFPIISTTSW